MESAASSSSKHTTKFPPESEEGNIEYKRHVLSKSFNRESSLKSQMLRRLMAGSGRCIYQLGIDDDGSIIGISKEDYELSKENLIAFAKSLQCDIIERFHVEKDGLHHGTFEVQLVTGYISLDVALCGHAQSGKSTLIGVLESGELDDGKGSARYRGFIHGHERISGKTSSITHKYIGIKNGEILNQKMFTADLPSIVPLSDRIITFHDLAGQPEYIKTTIRGLQGAHPSLAFLVEEAISGSVNVEAKDHIMMCSIWKIPMIYIITKIDDTINRGDVLELTIEDVKKTIKSKRYLGRVPMIINSIDQIDDEILSNTSNCRLVPIVKISSVTGEGLDIIKRFLSVFPPCSKVDTISLSPHFEINDTFSIRRKKKGSVSSGIGLVISGYVHSGKFTISKKPNYYLGPFKDGTYKLMRICDIHDKQISKTECRAGQHVCFLVKEAPGDDPFLRKSIRSGMIITDKDHMTVVRKVRAKIQLQGNDTFTMREKSRSVFYTGYLRTTIQVDVIEGYLKSPNSVDMCTDLPKDTRPYISSRQIGIVQLSFPDRPINVKVGDKFLLNEICMKAVGIITDILE